MTRIAFFSILLALFIAGCSPALADAWSEREFEIYLVGKQHGYADGYEEGRFDGILEGIQTGELSTLKEATAIINREYIRNCQ